MSESDASSSWGHRVHRRKAALKVSRAISRTRMQKSSALSANVNAAHSPSGEGDATACVCLVDEPNRAQTRLARHHAAPSSARPGLIELATLPEADMVLIAIVGTAGLAPALAAIEAGKDIAVASKEILVMAGETVMTAARAQGRAACCPWTASTTPSSNASKAATRRTVRRLILTASGGPFPHTARGQIWPTSPSRRR